MSQNTNQNENPTNQTSAPVLDDMTRSFLRTLDKIETSGDLTPKAAAHLRARMLAGEEVYPYIGTTCAWIWNAATRKYTTAAEYNALCEALDESLDEKGQTR